MSLYVKSWDPDPGCYYEEKFPDEEYLEARMYYLRCVHFHANAEMWLLGVADEVLLEREGVVIE